MDADEFSPRPTFLDLEVIMNRMLIIAGACWLLSAGLSSHLHPNRYREGRSQDPRIVAEANESALARILGEFRTGMSDILFIKTERYLHSGVGYVPHLTEELLSVQGTDQGVDDHLSEIGEDADVFHHEENVETLLPAASKDYRGWIGQMHRKVKPWRDPDMAHKHTDGKELIPWFKMMTVSDPGYIRGYVIGAFWLKRYNSEASLEFIEEGLVHNPDAFQLHLSKGMLLMDKARQLANPGAIQWENPGQKEILLKAKASFQTAASLMYDVRPSPPAEGNISDLPEWGSYQETDARAAVNMAILFEERYGDPENVETLRKKYHPLFPNNPRLKIE